MSWGFHRRSRLVQALQQTLSERLERATARLSAYPEASKPLAACVAAWLLDNPYSHHEEVPLVHRHALAQLEPLARGSDQSVPALFNQTLMLTLAAKTLSQPTLSEPLLSLQHAEFERMVKDSRHQPETYYQLDLPRKPCEKDLSLAAGRSLAIGGAWLVERRRVAIRNSWLPQRLQNIKVVQKIRHVLGLQPECLVVHTIERHLRHFKADKHEHAISNAFNYLRTQPKLAGIYRESWFLDPQVAKLSPAIAFLSELPIAHGARLYCKGPATPAMIADAVGKSPQRKAAYANGTYQPQLYAYFWSRDTHFNYPGTHTSTS